MKIAMIGVGFVGLTTAACLADFGQTVYAVNRSKEKSDKLKKGIVPFYEPGLSEIVKRNVEGGRLIFTTDYAKAIPNAEIVIIAVGTPTLETGEADISQVLAASEMIAKNLKKGYTVIIDKSTVPVGTADKVKKIINEHKKEGVEFDVASSPEFLKEGDAVNDTFNPSRVVIGTENKRAAVVLEKMFSVYKEKGIPFVYTDIRSAEMSKYAANAFLSTKISFINEIANICELVGADIKKVVEDIGYDPRIGKSFLKAGIGWGGSCFPKDTRALRFISGEKGYKPQILHAVIETNNEQRYLFIRKVKKALGDNLEGMTFGVLGLAYKAETDDVRYTPAETVIRELLREGAKVRAYDPKAMETFQRFNLKVDYKKGITEVVENADALLIITDWAEFKNLDFDKLSKLMKQKIIIDGRNLYSPKELKNKGFYYDCFGRK